jgi:hypothetical protein
MEKHEIVNRVRSRGSSSSRESFYTPDIAIVLEEGRVETWHFNGDCLNPVREVMEVPDEVYNDKDKIRDLVSMKYFGKTYLDPSNIGRIEIYVNGI